MVSMRLLVIEDEIKVARFIERGLREEGFTVETAPDGEVGLQRALETPYDLIILDVMLPEKDGFTVLSELRAKGCRARILMLTALDSETAMQKGIAAGADVYMTKPFSTKELMDAVTNLLAERR